MASGPAAGLALVDALASAPAMHEYHYLPSVRGHLLEQLGRCDEARAEFNRAAAMTSNAQERSLLLERASRLPRESNARSMKKFGAGTLVDPTAVKAPVFTSTV